MPVNDAARDMSPAAVEARLKAAEAVIHDLCAGTRRWTMSIPARPDYDPDLIIADALRDVRELRQAHDRRVSELIEANNREVERRRAAEARAADMQRAIDFAQTIEDFYDREEFLKAWRGGNLTEWPEFAAPSTAAAQPTPGDNQDMRIAIAAIETPDA